MPPKAKLNLFTQPFDGIPQTVEFFFEQLSDLQELNNQSDRELFALFKSKLQSNAFKFFIETQFQFKNTNYQYIRKEFINYFMPSEKN